MPLESVIIPLWCGIVLEHLEQYLSGSPGGGALGLFHSIRDEFICNRSVIYSFLWYSGIFVSSFAYSTNLVRPSELSLK